MDFLGAKKIWIVLLDDNLSTAFLTFDEQEAHEVASELCESFGFRRVSTTGVPVPTSRLQFLKTVKSWIKDTKMRPLNKRKKKRGPAKIR